MYCEFEKAFLANRTLSIIPNLLITSVTNLIFTELRDQWLSTVNMDALNFIDFRQISVEN
ncbi:hypothetical protein T4D_3433 [Trichinella pseudospiralis]|uniref:Uncharacterized protein n=1 Tax=Trichinella pseudospiralis TaxID=6337 RepID=A0A0V1F9K5_TRIPS|nr:hypothetical protein T4D_3433 [Trichinella pseudospiralis]